MSTRFKCALSAAHVAIFLYGFQLQKNDKELSHINEIGFSIYCSRGAALCLAVDMTLVMLPMCRKLLTYGSRMLAAVFGFTHGTVPEGSNSSTTDYHKYLAYHIVAFTAIHVLGHCVNFYRLSQLGRGPAMSFHLGTWAGITGYWMLLLLGIMFATTHKRIRKANFEVFWYSHHLAILVMVFFAFHGYGCFVQTNDGQCRGYGSWKYIVLASILYLVERILRRLESRRLIALTSAIAHPGRAIELNFQHPTLHYRPGQHIYLNIPQLSAFEWHPFTITSSPIEQCISLDIRQDGDWTGQLGDLLGYGRDKPKLRQAEVVHDQSLLPLIRVDGPYGGPKEDVLNFDHAVLIGTGNGITTFSGILRHIWFRHQETQSSRLKTLDLYWVSRDANKLDWFKALFSMEKTVELFRTGLIRIHIYFTSSGQTHCRRHYSPSQPSRRQSRDSIYSLRPTRSTGQYSDDDDDDESADEGEELLSPRDTLGGSFPSAFMLPAPFGHSSAQDRRYQSSSEATSNICSEVSAEGSEPIIGPNNIHFGRPNFAAVFDGMSESLGLSNNSRQLPKVGVFYCGSLGLRKILKQECRRKSSSSVQFTFSSE
ncbi:hypothetical protein BGZ94_005218 [Podila epigama]|nr:hypothetical protein BGZ94_005218 [Podila epigama]